MYENFFTTYNMVEPPKIYKDNPDLLIRDIELSNFILLPTVAVNGFTMDTDFEDYPGVVSPFNNTNESSLNTSFDNYFLTEYKKENPRNETKAPMSFNLALSKAIEINPEVEKYKNFLIKTAKRESGFNSKIQNSAGAPYYGYFQMGVNEIRNTTGLSIEEFRNNPVLLILGAVKLYKMNLKTIKVIGVYLIGKDKGYSDDALVAGAWMGGPGGVKTYLTGKGDPSDSHWYKNGKGGSSVGKIMNDWRKNE